MQDLFFYVYRVKQPVERPGYIYLYKVYEIFILGYVRGCAIYDFACEYLKAAISLPLFWILLQNYLLLAFLYIFIYFLAMTDLFTLAFAIQTNLHLAL